MADGTDGAHCSSIYDARVYPGTPRHPDRYDPRESHRVVALHHRPTSENPGDEGEMVRRREKSPIERGHRGTRCGPPGIVLRLVEDEWGGVQLDRRGTAGVEHRGRCPGEVSGETQDARCPRRRPATRVSPRPFPIDVQVVRKVGPDDCRNVSRCPSVTGRI